MSFARYKHDFSRARDLSISNRENGLRLAAFLVWNSLSNGLASKLRSSYQRFRFYWASTRERYQVQIFSYFTRLNSWADGILEDVATNRRGGHSGGAAGGGVAGAIKGFLIGIIIYFVAIAVVYTIGTSGIITNTLIQSQIKTAAYNMAVVGGLIGLVGGVLFLLKVLGGI